MELYYIFKRVFYIDTSAVVICDLSLKVVYMNPTAAERYKKSGGYALVGSSLLDCHNKASNEKIEQVVEWFGKSPDNNRVYTFYNQKENKDVYMIALRDGSGKLIGYYEKHEYRNRETAEFYAID
ncbi:MAG: PAS domain-containing protein [Oscillospiraceae bacterium]|nr:PAS domain-containing protein [Oscillospiraceae bacterium]